MPSLATFEVQRFPFKSTTSARYLFNEVVYLKEYDVQYLIRFYGESKNHQSIALTGVLKDNEFISVPWATFGGIEADEGISIAAVKSFISQLLEYTREFFIQSISITMPPEVSVTKGTEIKSALLDAGFKTTQQDINQHIKVTHEPYRKLVNYNEHKKLKKSEREGFEFRKLGRAQLQLAYELIKDNRVRKGFPVSMTMDKLDNMFKKFPDHYFLFGVYNGDELIATAVSIRIAQNVIYNFYHGDHAEYRVFSPVVMLIEGIYSYCQKYNIEILDLGISSEKGKLNEGLFKFKQNCGAQTSFKNVLTYAN